MDQDAGPGGVGLADPGTFVPVTDGLETSDPLGFAGYRDTLERARESGSAGESVSAGPAVIGGHEVELALFDFGFLGGSMGEVAGERVARAMERAAERGVPFVLRTATGGARMQEGMRALVQMAKVTSARIGLAEAGCPFVCVLGNPSTGGVLAGLAALADVIAAESDATIGFAGPRLVRNYTGKPLEDGSHTARSAWRNGLVDALVTPEDARAFVASVLEVLAPDDPRSLDEPSGPASIPEPWEAFMAVRSPDRPKAPDLVRKLGDALVELRGDRSGSDDPALFCSVARVAGRRAVLTAMDRVHRRGPAAYRKARRCIALAERLRLPLVTIVDTGGADPSEPAEASGIAWHIAATFEAFLNARTATLSIVTGEGGSGGALALALADRLVVYSDAVFTIIEPESAAEILWRDPTRTREAAAALKPTADELVRLGIADDVVPAPLDEASLAAAIASGLDRVAKEAMPVADVVARRRARWRWDAQQQA